MKKLVFALVLLSFVYFALAGVGTVSCDKLTLALGSRNFPLSNYDTNTSCNYVRVSSTYQDGLKFEDGHLGNTGYICVGKAVGAQKGNIFYQNSEGYFTKLIGPSINYNFGDQDPAPHNYPPAVHYLPLYDQPGEVSSSLPDIHKVVLGVTEHTYPDVFSQPYVFSLAIGGTETPSMSFTPLDNTFLISYEPSVGSWPPASVNTFYESGFISRRGTKVTVTNTTGPVTEITFEYPKQIKNAYYVFNDNVPPANGYIMKTYIEGYLDSSNPDDRLNSCAGNSLMPSSLTSPGYCGRRITNAEAPALVKTSVVKDAAVGKTYVENENYYFYTFTSFSSSTKKVMAKNSQAGYEMSFAPAIPVCACSTPSPADCTTRCRTDRHRIPITVLGISSVNQNPRMTIYKMANFDANGGGSTGISWTGVPQVTIGNYVDYKQSAKVGDSVTYYNGCTALLTGITVTPSQTATFKVQCPGQPMDVATLTVGGPISEYNKYNTVISLLSTRLSGSTKYAEVEYYMDKLVLNNGQIVSSDNNFWAVKIIGGGPLVGASLARLQVYRMVIADFAENQGFSIIQVPGQRTLKFEGLDECGSGLIATVVPTGVPSVTAIPPYGVAPAPSQATPSFAQQFGIILLAIVILLAFLFFTQRAQKTRARKR